MLTFYWSVIHGQSSTAKSYLSTVTSLLSPSGICDGNNIETAGAMIFQKWVTGQDTYDRTLMTGHVFKYKHKKIN